MPLDVSPGGAAWLRRCSGVRKVDAVKAIALRNWPDASCLEDIVSMRAYANYIREYIPNFADLDVFLRPCLKKGARFLDYQRDKDATTAYSDMRAAVAEDAELACVDYRLAAKGIAGGCPLELYIDASDYAWAATLAQRPAPDKAPRPIAVFSKSFTATEANWSAFERELYGLREGGSGSDRAVHERV